MLSATSREPSEIALTIDRFNVAQPLDKKLDSIKESASGRDEYTLKHNNGQWLVLSPCNRVAEQLFSRDRQSADELRGLHINAGCSKASHLSNYETAGLLG